MSPIESYAVLWYNTCVHLSREGGPLCLGWKKERNDKMKVIKYIAAIAIIASVTILMTGCDPDKAAGPGGVRTQTYNPSNGQYN